jgi:hypothetical protein
MALRIGGRRSTSPLMRPPLTTFSGELVASATAATREDARAEVALQAALPRLVGDAVGRAAQAARSGCRAARPPPGGAPPRPPRRCARATRPAPLRRAEAQSGPDQRREHHACDGPPPASPKPRRASGASRATAICPSSPPRDPSRAQPHPDRGGRRCSRQGHSPARDRPRRSTTVGTSSGNWAR